MKDTIKNYGELKKLINHGDKVTLQGKLMSNDKVNRMPMSEVTLFLAQGWFEVECKSDLTVKPAIEGEFIGKGDEPKNKSPDMRDAMGYAAMVQAQQSAIFQRQQAGMQGSSYSGFGGVGKAVGLGGGIFG